MATAEQAETAYDITQSYFSTGKKSSNKIYFKGGFDFVRIGRLAIAADIGLGAAGDRISARDTNREKSAALQKGASFTGQSPLEIGAIWYNNGQGAKVGNCGIMAAVAMWVAYKAGVQPTDMWHVTVRNSNTRSSEMQGLSMSFGHSYAELGTVNDSMGPFVVDPWANVFCSLSIYPEVLKAKLDKWHSQGKRINVDWGGQNGKGWWTCANDEAILSLLANNRQRTALRGDQMA